MKLTEAVAEFRALVDKLSKDPKVRDAEALASYIAKRCAGAKKRKAS